VRQPDVSHAVLNLASTSNLGAGRGREDAGATARDVHIENLCTADEFDLIVCPVQHLLVFCEISTSSGLAIEP
jgi:hypothetical protein